MYRIEIMAYTEIIMPAWSIKMVLGADRNRPRHRNPSFGVRFTLLRVGRAILFFCGVVSGWMVLASAAGATQCVSEGSPASELQSSEVVFLGKIIEEKEIRVAPPGTETHEDGTVQEIPPKTVYVHTFEVEKAWKGISTKTVSMTGFNQFDCVIRPDRLGGRYLVYTNWNKESALNPQPLYCPGMCNRSGHADFKLTDSLYLDAAVEQRNPAGILSTLPSLFKTHPDPSFRASAAILLHKEAVQSESPEARSALLDGLKDSSPKVRKRVAWLLSSGDYGSAQKKVTLALIAAFQAEERSLKTAEDPESHYEVLGALSQGLVWYGDRQTRLQTLPYLIHELESGQRDRQRGAIFSLRQLGADARPAIPALKKLADFKYASYLREAAEALKKISLSKEP